MIEIGSQFQYFCVLQDNNRKPTICPEDHSLIFLRLFLIGLHRFLTVCDATIGFIDHSRIKSQALSINRQDQEKIKCVTAKAQPKHYNTVQTNILNQYTTARSCSRADFVRLLQLRNFLEQQQLELTDLLQSFELEQSGQYQNAPNNNKAGADNSRKINPKCFISNPELKQLKKLCEKRVLSSELEDDRRSELEDDKKTAKWKRLDSISSMEDITAFGKLAVIHEEIVEIVVRRVVGCLLRYVGQKRGSSAA